MREVSTVFLTHQVSMVEQLDIVTVFQMEERRIIPNTFTGINQNL